MSAYQSINGMVSVIVPVYNVKRYLSQCVESILSQTYRNFELILVDDGSTDGGGSQCDFLAAQDARIIVFHKKNGGLSSARNYGLNHAKGEYIVFIDSDDIVVCDLLESCLQALLQTQSDIVEYQYSSIDEQGNKHPFSGKSNDFHSNMSLTADEALCFLFKDQIQSYAWAFMAKRSLYETPEVIRFPENVIFEDVCTTYKLFARADKIFFLNKKLYRYRQRTGSIMRATGRVKISGALSFASMQRCEYFFDSSTDIAELLSDETRTVLLLRTLEEQVAAYYGILHQNDTGDVDDVLNAIKERIWVTWREVINNNLSIPKGTLIRVYAVKLHLAGILVFLEKRIRYFR